jgi:hypothetical protein
VADLTNGLSFEDILTVSEYTILLDEIDAVKGRFLRQLNKAVGGGLFDLLKDSTSARGLPLLRLGDQDIMFRPDCDPQWVNELTCFENTGCNTTSVKGGESLSLRFYVPSAC